MNNATTSTRDLFRLLAAGRPGIKAPTRAGIRPRSGHTPGQRLLKQAGSVFSWMMLAACVGAAIANWVAPLSGQRVHPIQRSTAQFAKPDPAPEAVQREVLPPEPVLAQAQTEDAEQQWTEVQSQAQTQVHTRPSTAPAIGPLVAQVAANAGVQTCAGRIEALSQFISANSDTGAYFFVPPSDPNQRLVSFSYEVTPDDARLPSAYASASFAPNQANGCGAIYEAIVYWPESCNGVARTQFSQFRAGRSMQKNILVLENETPTRVFLMPAGTGCVSVKKELVL